MNTSHSEKARHQRQILELALVHFFLDVSCSYYLDQNNPYGTMMVIEENSLSPCIHRTHHIVVYYAPLHKTVQLFLFTSSLNTGFRKVGIFQ